MKQIWKWLLRCIIRHKKRTEKECVREYLSSTRERQRIAQGIRLFFEKNYELRYNIMKQTEEFRSRSKETRVIAKKAGLISEKAGEWQQLTDRELRRIAIEQMEQVGVAWSIDVELYVRSALIPDYNPVNDFLDRCGAWDGVTDHIGVFAQRVPTQYKWWPQFFHRWMLAMVAQWKNLSRNFGNAVVPILIGAQGTHKSTFCRMLLPPELREYYIDDIKLDNAEQVERMLGRMLLVNIDEYNAKTTREQAKIKRVLTEKDVQTRRMRSDQYVMLPRMASFIATTNDREPLCDPTGSRRYLCCEIEGVIDTDTPVDYCQLYAQAIAELRQGAQWHFTKEEEAEIERHNQDYRYQSSPESVLLAWFEPAECNKKNFVKAIDIQNTLRQHLRPADVPSLKSLTLALKAAHFRYGAINGHHGWYAKEIVQRERAE